MHTANLQFLLREHGVIGSSPILAQGALGSSVGRARTQRKMRLVYIAGWSSRLARLAHYQKVSGSNPLPATIGYQPYPPEVKGKSVQAYLTLIKMPDSVNTDFVSFNYHWLDLLLRPPKPHNAWVRSPDEQTEICGLRQTLYKRRSKTY